MLPETMKRLDTLVVKKVNDGELLGLAPVVAVLRKGDVAAIVGELKEWLGERTVGEGEVMGFENFMGHVR